MAYEMRIEDNIVIFQFKSNKVSSIQLETLKALDQVIDRVNNEEDLKGIILVGTDRYFSGGFDLNEFVSFQGPQEIIDWFKIEEEVLYKLFICSKPVIAAVNGAATAAGMIVACAADYRIAMNHPKIKVGIRLMCTLNRLKKILTLIASPPMNKGSSTRVISITLPSAGDTTNPAAWGIVLGGLRKKKRQNKLTIAKTTPAVFQPITKQASDNRAGTAINTHPSKATISLCFIFIFLPACCRRPSFINATLT
jgi:hypothetical protein